MSNYEEWNGYLVRKGDSAKNCGFILPQDRKEYNKHNQKQRLEENKKEEQPAQPVSEKESKLNRIKRKLSELTKGKNPIMKRHFLKQNTGFDSFKEIEMLDNEELNKLIIKLTRLA